MSTLRISNIEAKSVPASATVDEKVKITNSSGDVLVFLDGKTSGITTVGINTTDGNITFDANSNVVVTGIITATKFVGTIEGAVSGDLSIADKIIHTGDTNTAIRFPAADTITAETGGSERLRITSAGNLKMPDSAEIQLGNDTQTATGDLRLFHNGSNSGIINSQGALYITNDATNSSDVHIRGKSSIQLHCPADGNVRLFIKSNGDIGFNDTSPTANASGNDTVLSIKGKGSSYSGKIDFKDSSGNIDNHIASDNAVFMLNCDPNSQNGNTSMQFSVHGGERLRIGRHGQIGIGGANYGTAGQVLTSQGSGSAVQWASPSNPTLPHAFVFMDSQYFTSSTTLLEFNNSTTGDRSSGVTITRGGSERFTPTVAGTYYVNATLHYFHGGGTYTPTLYLYRNGSSYIYTRGIVSYGGGHYDHCNVQAMMTFNGTSDYVDMRAQHNGGGNATMNPNSSLTMFRVGA